MNKDWKFDFNDIAIAPETISTINSRKEVNPFSDGGALPLMVSPMDSVINGDNWYDYFRNNMIVCLPRNEKGNVIGFNSISLEEFELHVAKLNAGTWFIKEYSHLLIDIANGHMERLYNSVKKFKEVDKNNTQLMVGNVANPKTYELFANLGVEYVRVGIGGGSACLTSANTGVHYPMASLIQECYEIKKANGFNAKIVADGGFRNFDDIIKALALGADYVMLGSILNKCIESCSPVEIFGITVSRKFGRFLWEFFPSTRKYIYKSYRGMSTKDVQKKWDRKEIKTSEGIKKVNKVEYSLRQWRQNFEDYLRSAMSYTNSRTLEEFKESEKVFITQQAFGRFHK